MSLFAMLPDGTIVSGKPLLPQSEPAGFIAPGVWNGGEVLNLTNGTTLDAGYIVMAEAVADQSQADRDARKAPPIYVCIKTAGAIHYVTIAVNVNR